LPFSEDISRLEIIPDCSINHKLKEIRGKKGKRGRGEGSETISLSPFLLFPFSPGLLYRVNCGFDVKCR
jgi:hypothetical protein